MDQKRDSFRQPTFEVDRDESGSEPVAVLRLLGEHDLGSADQRRRRLSQLLDLGNAIVVDLTETDFIDSSALKCLLQADQILRDRGRRLVLQYGTSSIVCRILEVSGVLETVPHAAQRESAVRLARGAPLV